jgi:hypothetical protein
MKRGGPLRRTPLARAAGLSRGTTGMARTRLQPVSAKRRDQRDEYSDAVAAAFLRDRWVCHAELLVREVECGGRIDPHHVHPTGQGGPRCDSDNIVACCRRHHSWIHQTDPERARELGLLR